MFEVKGKYGMAKIFADIVDNETISQITNLLNQPSIAGSNVRIMADCHAGAGCVIGTTMTIQDKVIPNLVGVDIGCGMFVIELEEKSIDFELLDQVVRNCIPSGFSIRTRAHEYIKRCRLSELNCIEHVNIDRADLSLGTLGGGNHFIEIDRSDDGRLFLVIHSGSRNLGKQTAEHYQKTAWEYLKDENRSQKIKELIDEIKKLKGSTASIPKELSYCEGLLFEQYIHDMKIVQEFAMENREAIADVILKEMKLHPVNSFSTIHNYIDTDAMILRKGAVSAKAGETLIIPINMRDGSLVCIGKGNPDYNFSAPHGAGRIMSRSKAKDCLSVDAFQTEMREAGIFTNSCNASTLDEAPEAYKPIESILQNISDTVEVVMAIKPVYNFKSSI